MNNSKSTVKRILLVGIVAFIAVSSALPTENPAGEKFPMQWKKFKTRFNKTYENENEEQRRMNIFREKLLRIRQENEKNEKGLRIVKINIDELSDRSADEWILSGKEAKPDIPIEDAAKEMLMNEWEKFKSDYQKTYSDKIEEDKRLNIFRDNLIRINEHNENYKRGKNTSRMDIQEHADWSDEEINEKGIVVN